MSKQIKNVPKVAVVTNVIPHYRVGFYDEVFAQDEFDVHIYCQRPSQGAALNTVHQRYTGRLFESAYKRMPGGVVLHWFPYLRLLMQYDIIFVDGNPRHMLLALFSTLFRLFGKKVVIWSTAHSHRNDAMSEKIRLAWWRATFKYYSMYVERDLPYMRARGFGNKVMVALNNGLNQKSIEAEKTKWTSDALADWKREQGLEGKTILLTIGRVLSTRYHLIAEALPPIVQAHPNVVWVVIGDGAGRQDLEAQVAQHHVEGFVHFAGNISDEAKLAPWFLNSELMVYSTAIGLSLIHAFGYGLPVITHDEEARHGPEFSAFRDGENGLLYKNGDSLSLANQVISALNQPDVCEKMRKEALHIATNKHNTHLMAKTFLGFLRQIT